MCPWTPRTGGGAGWQLPPFHRDLLSTYHMPDTPPGWGFGVRIKKSHLMEFTFEWQETDKKWIGCQMIKSAIDNKGHHRYKGSKIQWGEVRLLFHREWFQKASLEGDVEQRLKREEGKMMKENNLQPRLLYPARISFKYEGEIKSFSDKQKLREFCTTKPALQQILKDIL